MDKDTTAALQAVPVVETDVLVIGFGAAGASAALQARQAGCEVVLVDRFSGGGTTKHSGGVIYAGATRYQLEAGYEDDPENMLAYLLREVGDAVHPTTLRRFCESSAADIAWLEDLGVKFSSAVHTEKASFPPEGKYLYFSGNEKAADSANAARPVPRGHRPVGAGFGGPHLFAALRDAVRNAGIDVRLNTRATTLISDPARGVIGATLQSLPASAVAAHQRLHDRSTPARPTPDSNHMRNQKRIEQLERNGHALEVRARKGVILATGGYAFDPALLQEFSPQIANSDARFHRLATLGNDGSGIALARRHGAATRKMESVYVARHIVPAAFARGILINGSGSRFIAEDSYISLIGEAISRQQDGKSWLVMNSQTLKQGLRQIVGSGWYQFRYLAVRVLPNLLLGGTQRAGTVVALARKLGIDEFSLPATIHQHDARIALGTTDPFGKSDEMRAAIGTGPYYALNMNFANRRALNLLMTLGGLSVDEQTGQVLHKDGSALPGLFAAGNCAVGLHSNNYISGLALADAIFSGRRAGQAVAGVNTRTESAAPNRPRSPLPDSAEP